MTWSGIKSIILKGLFFIPKLLTHVQINLHYIIYHADEAWWSMMKHDGVFWFTCQVISKKALDYLWLLQLGRLINNRSISVSGNRDQTFFFCLILVPLMLFSLEFKPIRLLFQPAYESRTGFIMEITIFWFQKGHVVQSGMLLRLQPKRFSSSLLENGVLQMESHSLFEVPLRVAYSLV